MTVTTGGDETSADPSPAAQDAAAGSALRRRTLLGGLVGAALGTTGYLVGQDILPGRSRLLTALGRDGEDGGIPDVAPGPVLSGSFASAARKGVQTRWFVALPPGSEPGRRLSPAGGRLPVCVVLHGKTGNAETMLKLGYDRFLAAAVRAGVPPFAMASVDGGDRYWHAREAGDDSGRMVTDEYLPSLAGLGLAARPQDRIAFLGHSMGGFGSLLLAGRLGSERVAAVVAESPALWLDGADSAPGAFDDIEDFRRHDVFPRRGDLTGIQIKIDCGEADPFYLAAKSFAEGMDPRPAGTFGEGDHDWGYWRLLAPSAMDFVGRALDRR